MAYVTVVEVRRLLKAEYLEYPEDLTEHHSNAQATIDGKLAGHYVVPFDNVTIYAEVPLQIKQIAAWLVGASIWGQTTVLEGAVNSDKAEEWVEMAMLWLTEIAGGDMSLTDSTGVVISSTTANGEGIRSYPGGVREKAPSSDNNPIFTRAQAGEW